MIDPKIPDGGVGFGFRGFGVWVLQSGILQQVGSCGSGTIIQLGAMF